MQKTQKKVLHIGEFTYCDTYCDIANLSPPLDVNKHGEEELETNLESSTELSKVYVIWVAGLDGFKEVWST